MSEKSVLVDLNMNGNKIVNPAFDAGAIPIAALSTNPLSRTNHTGTQAAATISDFDSQVRLSRLDQMAVPTSAVSVNGQRVTNGTAPSAASDLATKQYVDDVANGTPWADEPVALIAVSNITLSGEQSIDGVTTAASRVLVAGQTTASQNGVYVTSAGAWSRAADLATGKNAANFSMFIERGTTYADTQWRCTSNTGSAVVGTSSLAFAQFGAGTSYSADGTTLELNGTIFSVKAGGVDTTQLADASVTETIIGTGSVTAVKLAANAVTTSKILDSNITDAKLASTFTKKHTTAIGNGTATDITVTHSLGTRAVVVQVYDSATYADVAVKVVRTTTTTATISFNTAPASNAYTVVVIG